MFKKLEFKLDIDFEKIKGDAMWESYGNSFYSYTLRDLGYFNNILNNTLKFNLDPFAINYTEISNEGASPHVDGPIIVLNYYLDVDNDATLFWEPKSPDTKGFDPIQGLDGGPINDNSTVAGYESDKVRLVSYFVAKPHTAYLIDASKIHSVKKRYPNTVRKFIRFFWENATFEEVLNSIEILPK